MTMSSSIATPSYALKQPFIIARGTKTHANVVQVTVSCHDIDGRSESVPYTRYGETVEGVVQAIRSVVHHLDSPQPAVVHSLLPAGSARNALEAACWDWQCRYEKKPIWELLAINAPREHTITAYTISIDTPTTMAKHVVANSKRNLFKIKLQGDSVDYERVAAVCHAAPQARFILDANEGVAPQDASRYCTMLEPFAAQIVCLEQPVAAKDDSCLFGLQTAFTLCADESCHTAADMPCIAKKYGMINVKLDKTGGLTEAVTLIKTAKARNLGIMLGCMVGSSLAMAPAFMLNAYADVLDLDGPLLLQEDVALGFLYDDEGRMSLPEPPFWGL